MKSKELAITELTNATLSEFLLQNEDSLTGQIPIILQFESIDGSGFQFLISLKKLFQTTGSDFLIRSTKQTVEQIRILGLVIDMEEIE